MEKSDPMNMFKSAKTAKIVQVDSKRQYNEADLHLKFCRWVKNTYPNDEFCRHEREGKRSAYMQNLMKCYNSDNSFMPDFELLEPCVQNQPGYFEGNRYIDTPVYHRLYIEFKAPGTTLTLKDGITIKPAYADQYKRHMQFWKQNSPAYFCSDLIEACKLLVAYKSGSPLPMQVFRVEKFQPSDIFDRHNSFTEPDDYGA